MVPRAPALVVLSLLLLMAVPLAPALPTPGVNGEAFEPVTGRIFPEPLETNDYVSYGEARAGLDVLNARHPERMEIRVLGPSVGWPVLGQGEREPHDVIAVEVTNEASPIADEHKLTVVFFLSIHGNEKGGREGGLRAIEDLVAGKGIAKEEPDLVGMLDYQKLVFIFSNTDGWTHEEVEYRASDACYVSLTCDYDPAGGGAGDPGVETQNFVRVNGNGTDLNRQFPTVGFVFPEFTTLAEPEAVSMWTYTQGLTNVVAGADIHGMLNHDYMYLMMLKDGKRTQQEIFENERLAELLKERINTNAHYAAWQTLPKVDDVGGGQFAEWASTFDSIGYSAPGTAGGYIVQDIGLDAPGFTVEMAYNHIVADNYYPGAGAQINDYHVRAVRDTVITFMQFAAEKVRLSVETHGSRVAVLSTAYVATDADDDKAAYRGRFTETSADDRLDLLHKNFTATPNEYWQNLRTFARNGTVPGVLDTYESVARLLENLGAYDTVVIPGSAVDKFRGDDAVALRLRAFAEAGGTVILTDKALATLEGMGLVEEHGVDRRFAYSGYTDIADREHPFVSNLRGFPRQTYDPNPLGFPPESSPVWYVTQSAWEKAGGVSVGLVNLTGDGPVTAGAKWPLAGPDVREGEVSLPLPTVAAPAQRAEAGNDRIGVNLGELKVGEGRVLIFGAVLPDPSEEAYHPYGLEGYAVSAAGNLILLNLLGYDYVYDTPPAVEELGFAQVLESGKGEPKPNAEPAASAPEEGAGVPAPGVALALAGLALVALARRRGAA